MKLSLKAFGRELGHWLKQHLLELYCLLLLGASFICGGCAAIAMDSNSLSVAIFVLGGLLGILILLLLVIAVFLALMLGGFVLFIIGSAYEFVLKKLYGEDK